jgi:hypothetical protein
MHGLANLKHKGKVSFKLRENLRNTESLFYLPHDHFQYRIHKYGEDTG